MWVSGGEKERSDEWIKDFAIGKKASKQGATHHDGAFNYYQVPNSHLLELGKRLTRLWMVGGKSLFLNEHAGKDCRLFLDLDSNKKEGEVFRQSDLFNFVVTFNYRLKRNMLVGEDPLFISQQKHGGESGWCVKDDPDPYTVLVLASRKRGGEEGEAGSSTNIPLFSYHLVWPFLRVNRESVAAVLSQVACPPAAHVDFECLRRGTLRGIWQGKGVGDKSPYVLQFVLNGAGDLLDKKELFPMDDEEEYQFCLWKATSLLLPMVEAEEWTGMVDDEADEEEDEEEEEEGEEEGEEEAEEPPTKRQRPLTVPRDDCVAKNFMNNQKEFNAQELHQLLRQSIRPLLAKKTKQEVFDNVLTDTAVSYLNQVIAFISSAHPTIFTRYVADNKGKKTWFPLFITLTGALSYFKTCEFTYWKKKSKKVSRFDAYDAWMTSPDRLEFNQTVMKLPDEVGPGELNLWRGIVTREQCEEKRGYQTIGKRTGRVFSIDTILNHIYSFFCAKDIAAFDYVRKWLASVVQFPLKKLGTALYFISDEGIGKDLILNYLFDVLLGDHFLFTSDITDLIGKFTAMVEGKTLAFVDEVDTVDNASHARLKSLITEKMVRLEKKYRDVMVTNNVLNIIMTSNVKTRQTIKFGNTERRIFPLECESSIRSDHDYFSDLVDFLGTNSDDKSGYLCIADYLYNVDLSDWNERVLPKSHFLEEKKLENMNTVQAWWCECLEKGQILGFGIGSYYQNQGQDWENGDLKEKKQTCHENYSSWCRFHQKTPVMPTLFWRYLKQVCDFKQARKFREAREVVFPPLPVCRSSFRAVFSSAFEEDELRMDAYAVPQPQWASLPDPDPIPDPLLDPLPDPFLASDPLPFPDPFPYDPFASDPLPDPPPINPDLLPLFPPQDTFHDDQYGGFF